MFEQHVQIKTIKQIMSGLERTNKNYGLNHQTFKTSSDPDPQIMSSLGSNSAKMRARYSWTEICPGVARQNLRIFVKGLYQLQEGLMICRKC